MFTTDGYFYKAKRLDLAENVKQIVKGLSSLRKVIVIDYAKKSNLMLRSASDQNHPTALDPELVLNGKEELKCTTCSYAEYVKECDMEDEENIVFEQVGFDHPVYIMFTSGTTGKYIRKRQKVLNDCRYAQMHGTGIWCIVESYEGASIAFKFKKE